MTNGMYSICEMCGFSGWGDHDCSHMQHRQETINISYPYPPSTEHVLIIEKLNLIIDLLRAKV